MVQNFDIYYRIITPVCFILGRLLKLKNNKNHMINDSYLGSTFISPQKGMYSMSIILGSITAPAVLEFISKIKLKIPWLTHGCRLPAMQSRKPELNTHYT